MLLHGLACLLNGMDAGSRLGNFTVVSVSIMGWFWRSEAAAVVDFDGVICEANAGASVRV